MKAILAAAALSVATALPSVAFDPANMSESEKESFGIAIREYLMANPEVLIESINVLEVRRANQELENDRVLVESNQDALFADGHSWVGGNPDGDITLVEFVDYKCGFCRRVNPEVETLIRDDGNIRFIIKEFPILGQESDLAARFAISVKQIAGDAVYKRAHDELMVLRGAVSLESLGELAERMDLDSHEVINRMNTEDVTAVIRANQQLAERMRIMGTPTFVIGAEMLRGVPPQGMAAAVAEVREMQGG